MVWYLIWSSRAVQYCRCAYFPTRVSRNPPKRQYMSFLELVRSSSRTSIWAYSWRIWYIQIPTNSSLFICQYHNQLVYLSLIRPTSPQNLSKSLNRKEHCILLRVIHKKTDIASFFTPMSSSVFARHGTKMIAGGVLVGSVVGYYSLRPPAVVGTKEINPLRTTG